MHTRIIKAVTLHSYTVRSTITPLVSPDFTLVASYLADIHTACNWRPAPARCRSRSRRDTRRSRPAASRPGRSPTGRSEARRNPRGRSDPRDTGSRWGRARSDPRGSRTLKQAWFSQWNTFFSCTFSLCLYLKEENKYLFIFCVSRIINNILYIFWYLYHNYLFKTQMA